LEAAERSHVATLQPSGTHPPKCPSLHKPSLKTPQSMAALREDCARQKFMFFCRLEVDINSVAHGQESTAHLLQVGKCSSIGDRGCLGHNGVGGGRSGTGTSRGIACMP
jgi:hypothetical protein